MIAVFVVLDIAVACKDVHQSSSIPIDEQAEGLLLVIGRDQMVLVRRLDQVARISKMPAGCLA